MLEGRRVELIRLAELVAELRDGRGRSLLLRAESQDLEVDRAFACAALGFLELSLERVPEAIGYLERAPPWTGSTGSGPRRCPHR